MNPIELRLPELTGGTEAEQLQKIRSYLYSLAEQLQFALDGEQTASAVTPVRAQSERQTLNEVKALILRSAEVTEKLSEEVEHRLTGRYVAVSQFGTFTQQTEQRFLATDQELRQEFTERQRLESRLEQVSDAVTEVTAGIRTGALYTDADGVSVYGMEIGQQIRENGALRFRKFARLTADRLAFFDSNDIEVAYISDNSLHVTTIAAASVTSGSIAAARLQIGDYLWNVGADGHISLR